MGLGCGSSDNLDRDALIDKVAAANKRTVVVMETGAPVLTPWRDKVAGLLEAWYPGVEGGTALARVLFGDVNPSGHLPATFPKREADEPTSGDPETYPGVAETVTYKEGVFVGYRWYDSKNITPAYPFGFGLSYTRFAYSGLKVAAAGADGAQKVSFTVRNTGSRAGTDVPQVYLGDAKAPVPEPPKRLAGFRRIVLKAGQSRTVTIPVARRSRQYWDVASSSWKDLPGCLPVLVGASSRDISLRSDLCAKGTAALTCPARRRIVFHVSGAHRGRVVKVVAYLNGKRVKVFRGHRIAKVFLRSPLRSSFTVRLVSDMSTHRRFVTTYRFKKCRRTSTVRRFTRG
jgi:beta-glucosidase